MALLCFAEDKPEAQWFDAKYFEQVQEIISKAKRLYQDHSLLKSRLDETYTDGIYEFDLDGLIARYSGEYKSSLKILIQLIVATKNKSPGSQMMVKFLKP